MSSQPERTAMSIAEAHERWAIRPMREDECEAVAAMVRALARDTDAPVVPRMTGAMLAAETRGPNPLIEVLVAEQNGRLAGACLYLMTFSTWWGARGLYVV